MKKKVEKIKTPHGTYEKREDKSKSSSLHDSKGVVKKEISKSMDDFLKQVYEDNSSAFVAGFQKNQSSKGIFFCSTNTTPIDLIEGLCHLMVETFFPEGQKITAKQLSDFKDITETETVIALGKKMVSLVNSKAMTSKEVIKVVEKVGNK